MYAYVRGDKWKKSYRYTLIDEFRKHITFAKNAYIYGYEKLKRFRDEKEDCYMAAMAELSIVESNKDYSTETYYKQQYKLLKRQLKSSTP